MPEALAERTETQLAMLEAAKAALRKRGIAGLSTREVAAAAGVPLSQIHYHFGSKQGLVLALFEHLNEQLLDRQEHLFGDPSLELSEQWDRACDYLDEDIASGYVRVMHELAAAGWSDPEVAKAMRNALLGWIRLVTAVAQRAEERFGAFGPFSAEEVGALVSNAFIGAESFILSGVERNRIPVRQSLRRVGDLIRLMERKAG
jgi:AcrR family transcriptional regulator